MHAVSPLISGIPAAANGSAVLNARGTATTVTYYKDFEASQAYTVSPIQLDSDGSAVVYVNALVDVLVRDVNGSLVREFVAGAEAPAVEVISPSFTGTSYSDGSSGTSKPTNLQVALDAWFTSAGAPDFNVIPTGGTKLTLAAATAALQGLFFNVKTYGALGNGVADDGGAIQAAYTAAAATSAGGGTVFFPPGVYRSTISIAVTAGTKTLGSGGRASKLSFEGGALAVGLNVQAGSAMTSVQDMWIGAQVTNFTGSLVFSANGAELHMLDCTIGADAFSARCYQPGGGTSPCSLTRCRFESRQGASSTIVQGVAQPVQFTECDFVSTQTVGFNQVNVVDGAAFNGCRFYATAATSGGANYIYATPGLTYDAVTVRGCYFAANFTVPPTALYNALAAPITDFIESDNIFGGGLSFSSAGIIPYGYATDGYAPFSAIRGGSHGSRRFAIEPKTGAAITANPKAYGATIIQNSAGAAVALTIGSNGTYGDTWILQVVNTSGGALTVTPSGQILLDAGAATFAVANNTMRQMMFTWGPNTAGTTPGVWRQVGPSTQA